MIFVGKINTSPLLIVASALLLAVGCQSFNSGESFETRFWGSIQDYRYQNPYFGFQTSIPQGWAIQDTGRTEALARQMQARMGKGDSTSQTPFAAQLMTAYKYPVGASVSYNPSAQIVAERINPQMRQGGAPAYLMGVRRLLEQTSPSYSFPEEVYSTRIGQRDFYVLEADLNLEAMLARQMYYISLEKGYALGFVLSFASREQRDELEDQFLETIVFE